MGRGNAEMRMQNAEWGCDWSRREWGCRKRSIGRIGRIGRIGGVGGGARSMRWGEGRPVPAGVLRHTGAWPCPDLASVRQQRQSARGTWLPRSDGPFREPFTRGPGRRVSPAGSGAGPVSHACGCARHLTVSRPPRTGSLAARCTLHARLCESVPPYLPRTDRFASSTGCCR